MKLTTPKYVRPCISPNPTPHHHHHHHHHNTTSTTYKPITMKAQTHVINSEQKLLKNPIKFSENWKDYQGGRNWEGLLDPLDENLRSEIIRYGHFVEAAYRSCDFDQSSPSYATCRFTKKKLLKKSGFSGTGYKVTKNLTATSGIQLPGWTERGPPWLSVQSSWIGYVAVCQDRDEISRLGRRDVVIALRGTATGLEWLENLRATLTLLSDPDPGSGLGPDSGSDLEPMVESGFLSLYTSRVGKRMSLQSMLREEVGRILDKYGGGGDVPLSFTITGHSLGAALATLAAYDIKQCFGRNSPPVTVISFAGPRVGNWRFRCGLEEQGTKVLRIVNSDDVVTKVPGFVIDNNEGGGGGERRRELGEHSGGYTAAAAAGFAGWVQKLVEDTQWVYADVGCELRLSSRDSPHLNGISIATCHELKTYLHLVDGFVGSNCPFKATAIKNDVQKVKTLT